MDELKERVEKPLFALIEVSRWSATCSEVWLTVKGADIYHYKDDVFNTY
jgi:hypothetical protein